MNPRCCEYCRYPHCSNLSLIHILYEGDPGTIKDIAIKGISEIHQKSSGDTCQVSVQYKGDFETDGDTFRYLTINFVSQEDGWKIDFYGVEG